MPCSTTRHVAHERDWARLPSAMPSSASDSASLSSSAASSAAPAASAPPRATRDSSAASAALLSALHAQDLTEARLLLSKHAHGLDVNVSDESGRTPLHLLASSVTDGGADVCELIVALVGRGAALEAANAHGTTPLQKAVLGNHVDAAVTLVRMGADLNTPNQKSGLSALALARTDALVDAMRRAAAARKGQATCSAAPGHAAASGGTLTERASRAPHAGSFSDEQTTSK